MARTSTVVDLPHSPSADHLEEGPSFDELIGVLQYNQGLVEFADSKAGSLILLNSLLIAAVAALPNAGHMGMFKMASVLVASAAVFLCFQVITSRAGSGDTSSSGPVMPRKSLANGWESSDFVFFGCISKHKTCEDYVRAFERSSADSRQRALLHRSYVLAGIAQRKFSQYAIAQQATTAAMTVWVAVNVLPFVGL